jgi:hypothetical protein
VVLRNVNTHPKHYTVQQPRRSSFCCALTENKADSWALLPMSVKFLPRVLTNRCSFLSYSVVLLIYSTQDVLPPAALSFLWGGRGGDHRRWCDRNWAHCLSRYSVMSMSQCVERVSAAAGFHSFISLKVYWCNVQWEWFSHQKCEQDGLLQWYIFLLLAGGRVVRPPRAAQSKGRQYGRQNEEYFKLNF